MWTCVPGGGEAATTVTSAATGEPPVNGPATAMGETVSGSLDCKEFF